MAETQLRESWTVGRTADYLGLSSRSVRRLASDGRLSGYKVKGKTGLQWHIYAESVEAYLQRKQVDSRSDIVRVSDRVNQDSGLAMMSDLITVMQELVGEIKGLREELRQEVGEGKQRTARPWWQFWGAAKRRDENAKGQG